jgi:hypothetical protein
MLGCKQGFFLLKKFPIFGFQKFGKNFQNFSFFSPPQFTLNFFPSLQHCQNAKKLTPKKRKPKNPWMLSCSVRVLGM